MHREDELNATSPPVRFSPSLALLLVVAAACGGAPPPALPSPADTAAVDLEDPDTEILWDTWGVPHIFASDAPALFRAFGWAQMRNHGNLVLRLYGESRARAAEYWGEEYVDQDVWLRTNGVAARAQEWLDAQPADARLWVEAFTDGINAYAEAHADSLSEESRRVLPVEPVDVLAHMQRVLFYEFLASRGAIEAAARAWRAGGEVRQTSPRGGSNGWAIAPSRSESRRAMLLANPHLPWAGQFTWFEAQLHAPGINAYGAALVGFPMPGIAFNDHLGWTHTVNTIDAVDLYALTTTGYGYRWDDGERAFSAREEVLRVRKPDGSLEDRRVSVRSSVHGPIVAEREDGTVLALRVAGLDRLHLITQTWRMLRSQSLSEFETALAMNQLPLFSVIYADREGHILHVSAGAIPVRSRGDWRTWSGILPGDTSAWLWSATHPYQELPRLADPGTGFVQNANEPPWTTTLPLTLRQANFPDYMAPPPRMSFRAQNSARMLYEDPSISFEEMVRYKHSTRMTAADHLLEDVIVAVRAGGNGIARRAADVLERWDRTTDASSRGGILFQTFWRELMRLSAGDPFAVDWTLNAPLSTPDGIANPEHAVHALTAAATEVEARFRTLEVPWGNVYRLRIGGVDLPANGGPGALGVFRVTEYDETKEGARVAGAGDSWIAAVEFGPTVRALSLVAYGNASQPGSPHLGDQLRLYSGKMLREVWRTREEIEANLHAREGFMDMPPS